MTIDAARLDDVASLDAPWRFHAGDGPAGDAAHYADPGFDDSGWPLIRAGQAFADAHLPSAPPGSNWARIHLRIVNAAGPIGIAILSRSGEPYAVFANGRPIGASPGMATATRQMARPFAIALPQGSSDIVLAVHGIWPRDDAMPYFFLSHVDIGHLGAVVRFTDLNRIRRFDAFFLTGSFAAIMFAAFIPIALTLFRAQRDHMEYLWLAIFCVSLSAITALGIAQDAGVLPLGRWSTLLVEYAAFGCLIAGLEFVARFTRVQRLWPVRAFQCAALPVPLLGQFGPGGAFGVAVILILSIWLLLLSIYLLHAYRSGKAESGLLLPAFAFFAAVQVLQVASEQYPAKIHLPPVILVGHVGLDLRNLSSLAFVSGLLAVILYRFIRVSRDEQRAAGELEAARTVQQVLIPEELPAIPGYTIASVYRPAQQVGGDFFQVLPLPAGSPGEPAALIVLGDVSGKGLQAAMTVAVLVGALRTLAEFTQSPGELLSGLNRRLYGRGSGFTTCIILRIACSGEVIAANAGHLQPYQAGRELELESGLPLGLIPDATYPEGEFTLAPGESLTLLTDGVVEATAVATRELFGFERTQAISRQAANAIAEAARAFGVGAPQADDITVLTVARTAA